jgi:hypothetical protein
MAFKKKCTVEAQQVIFYVRTYVISLQGNGRSSVHMYISAFNTICIEN